MTLEIKNNQIVFDGVIFTPEETEQVFQKAKEYSNFIQSFKNNGGK